MYHDRFDIVTYTGLNEAPTAHQAGRARSYAMGMCLYPGVPGVLGATENSTGLLQCHCVDTERRRYYLHADGATYIGRSRAFVVIRPWQPKLG